MTSAKAVTWSFVSKKRAEPSAAANRLELANPIASDLSDMRPSLAPGLLAAAQRSADRGYGDVALFEVGQVFPLRRRQGPVYNAAGLRRGTAKVGAPAVSGDSAQRNSGVDVFDAKADARLALLASLGVSARRHPDRARRTSSSTSPAVRRRCRRFGPKNIVGWFGRNASGVLEALDVEGTDRRLPRSRSTACRRPPSRPQRSSRSSKTPTTDAAGRDFAFIVDRATRRRPPESGARRDRA